MKWLESFRQIPLGVLPIIALLVFAIFATREIMLPGVELDEVNADYLAVKMLDATKVGTPSWQIQDNVFSPNLRWPVLNTIYAGHLGTYLGLPFAAFFGFNVPTLRFYHACYGLAIIALGFAIVYRTTINRWVAFAVMLMLAVDAGFLLTFRTQHSLLMYFMAFFLLAIFLILPRQGELSSSAPKPVYPSQFFLGGISYGLACYGYFIYAFFAPALLLSFLMDRTNVRLAHWGAFIVGGLIGFSPWIFGMGSLWYYAIQSNVSFSSYLSDTTTHFVVADPQNLTARLSRLVSLLLDAISNFSQPQMVTGTDRASALNLFKLFLTLGACAVGATGVLLWGRREERRVAGLIAMCLLSFLLVSMLFGQRMAMHHFNVNLPLVYIFIGIAFASWWRVLESGVWQADISLPAGTNYTRHVGWSSLLAISLVLTFLFISIQQQASLFRELRRTGGVGYFSEMRVLLAYDLLSNYRNAVAFFPEWGFFAQVLYLTAGEVPMNISAPPDPKGIISALCAGKDVLIFVNGGDRRPHVVDAAARAGVQVAAWKTYHQRDGQPNFEMGLVSAKQPALT